MISSTRTGRPGFRTLTQALYLLSEPSVAAEKAAVRRWRRGPPALDRLRDAPLPRSRRRCWRGGAASVKYHDEQRAGPQRLALLWLEARCGVCRRRNFSSSHEFQLGGCASATWGYGTIRSAFSSPDIGWALPAPGRGDDGLRHLHAGSHRHRDELEPRRAALQGLHAVEIIGQHFSRFYTEEDRASGLPARALETAAREGKFESEGWRVRKDGTRFWAYVVIDPIRQPSGEIVGFAKITRDLTERRAAEEALTAKRGAVPAAGAGRHRLRHLHARPGRPS